MPLSYDQGEQLLKLMRQIADELCRINIALESRNDILSNPEWLAALRRICSAIEEDKLAGIAGDLERIAERLPGENKLERIISALEGMERR